jgi:hypothetical protein
MAMSKRKPAAKKTGGASASTGAKTSTSSAQPKFGSPAWNAKYGIGKKRGKKKTGST